MPLGLDSLRGGAQEEQSMDNLPHVVVARKKGDGLGYKNNEIVVFGLFDNKALADDNASGFKQDEWASLKIYPVRALR